MRKPQQPAHEKPAKRSKFAFRVYPVDEEQRAEIERKAKLLGLSVAKYLLMAGLERPDRVR